MRVDRVFDRLNRNIDDRKELSRTARLLGEELPLRRVEVVQEFCSRLADLSRNAGDMYAAGFCAGILEVSRSFNAVVRKQEGEQDIEKYILTEGYIDILLALYNGKYLPSDLADELHIPPATVSRHLAQLRDLHLVEGSDWKCADGRHKPHRLTQQGRRLTEKSGRNPEMKDFTNR
ncbi:MAG: MarR family transcriptional regulator [Parcubacteria group bacterium Gr01-1014_48]|nr:MAG: MarR family transcriptional regulator [Parcubacteria group bacterium Greene0416_14]TSC73477.1 MAG: MarR family transcriptional regulator [Parcubacteria group bacterium Gr01-1014_48]TSD00556.1 MAG: MarR family transcriptional regulator [Parcubacteria group bacterium Greene1014_15]TSD08249.1 MAG: MarR family transcriptional regulator [Parcubacteria group bacterium Greene0714_4]